MTEQVKLQQFGAAAVRNERLAARARHEHPLVPAKPCASRQKCHSVVYTVREDELAAVAASMNSVLHRSKEPERVCFHLIVPVGMDTGKLCRVTMAHAADNPDRFCPLKNGVLSQTEHFCPQAELLPIKGVAFNTTRGEHWVGECFCGTSQVRINYEAGGGVVGVWNHGVYVNPARSGPRPGETASELTSGVDWYDSAGPHRAFRPVRVRDLRAGGATGRATGQPRGFGLRRDGVGRPATAAGGLVSLGCT
jgi:hypothetical protein